MRITKPTTKPIIGIMGAVARSRAFEALSWHGPAQETETQTRNSTFSVHTGGVNTVAPPKDMSEYWKLFETTPIVRASLNQFADDVVEPGYRVEADDPETVAFFTGPHTDPDTGRDVNSPRGDYPDGWLPQAGIIGGLRHRDFHPVLRQTVLQRWVRGTALIEHVKENPAKVNSRITGAVHILPESVRAKTHPGKTLLYAPNEKDAEGAILTRRGEAAAFVQFDERSILGLRGNFGDRQTVPLSLNDVTVSALNPDVDDVFGHGAVEAIVDDVTGFKNILRDRELAIKAKAYGIWDFAFGRDVINTGFDRVEIVEWSKEDMEEYADKLEDTGPGAYLTHDGTIKINRIDGEVPDLDDTLAFYVDNILSGLPVPKFTVGFEENINQFVTENQDERYEKMIRQEREAIERDLTPMLRLVAEREGLNPSGLRLRIEPEDDESPIMSLDETTLTAMNAWTQSAADLFGAGNVHQFVDAEILRTMALQLPEGSEAAEPVGPDPGSEPDGDPADQAGDPPDPPADDSEEVGD